MKHQIDWPALSKAVHEAIKRDIMRNPQRYAEAYAILEGKDDDATD